MTSGSFGSSFARRHDAAMTQETVPTRCYWPESNYPQSGVSVFQFINPINQIIILSCATIHFFVHHQKKINESKHFFSSDSSGERKRGARNCSSVQYQRRQCGCSFRNDGLHNSIRGFHDWICTHGVPIAVQVLHVNQFIIVINWASHKNLKDHSASI